MHLLSCYICIYKFMPYLGYLGKTPKGVCVYSPAVSSFGIQQTVAAKFYKWMITEALGSRTQYDILCSELVHLTEVRSLWL